MPTSGKRGSPAKAEVTNIEGKGAQTLPERKALMSLARGKHTLNDYSKVGRPITENGPSIADPEKK